MHQWEGDGAFPRSQGRPVTTPTYLLAVGAVLCPEPWLWTNGLRWRADENSALAS